MFRYKNWYDSLIGFGNNRFLSLPITTIDEKTFFCLPIIVTDDGIFWFTTTIICEKILFCPPIIVIREGTIFLAC